MTSQLDFSGRAGGARKMAAELPKGFRYEPELIGPADEAALLAFLHELPFRDFEFHGYTGKRRVVSFGWHYDFSHSTYAKAERNTFSRPLKERGRSSSTSPRSL